jgi:hypothetical protein
MYIMIIRNEFIMCTWYIHVVFFIISDLRTEVIVLFVDIGGIIIGLNTVF